MFYVGTTMLGSHVDTSSRKDFMGAILILDMEAKLKMLMDVKELIDLELKAFNFDRLVVNDKKQKAQIELKSALSKVQVVEKMLMKEVGLLRLVPC